jgi:release factor glutamine methyltransferase
MRGITDINELFKWSTDSFFANRIDNPKLESELLLSAVLNCPRLDLYRFLNRRMASGKLKTFKRLVDERCSRKPLAYILGEHEFMGFKFYVNRHTLIPRPETELLTEEALKILDKSSNKIIADICTGCGNIAVSLAKMSNVKKIYAVDISKNALKVAKKNIMLHKQSARIKLKQGDLLKALKRENLEKKLDIIVSNPPYVAAGDFGALEPELSFEPRIALYGGKSGLDFYERLAAESWIYLRSGGILIMEMNSDKSPRIKAILEHKGYIIQKIVKDYQNLERIIIAVINAQ